MLLITATSNGTTITTRVILNVDGSCHDTPTRTCFGGVLRNNSSFFLAGFSGYILRTYDILLVELSPIYHGLIIAKNLGYVDLACYSDYLVCINLINGSIERYHVYVALIQYIKNLLLQSNITVSHTLRDGNQSADFMMKLGASSDVGLLLREAPSTGLNTLLRSDTTDTFYLRE